MTRRGFLGALAGALAARRCSRALRTWLTEEQFREAYIRPAVEHVWRVADRQLAEMYRGLFNPSIDVAKLYQENYNRILSLQAEAIEATLAPPNPGGHWCPHTYTIVVPAIGEERAA